MHVTSSDTYGKGLLARLGGSQSKPKLVAVRIGLLQKDDFFTVFGEVVKSQTGTEIL